MYVFDFDGDHGPRLDLRIQSDTIVGGLWFDLIEGGMAWLALCFYS